jgi:DNA modification methylase
MPTDRANNRPSLGLTQVNSDHGVRPLTIVYLPTEELQLNPDNPRVHSEKQIRQIARSIKAFGFNVPIQINRQTQVVGGHGRLEAAKVLGLATVPTIELEHLTLEQQIAFAIADNKLTENSKWDERLLAEQVKFLSEVDLDFSLEATGFEVAEIDVLIEGLAPASENGHDAADVLPEPRSSAPVTKLGDLWLLNSHRVLCENSLNENSFRVLMQNRKASTVFVDPPYNLPIDRYVGGLGAIKHREFAMASGEMSRGEFTDFLAQSFRLLLRYSVDPSIHFACGDWRHIREFLDAGYQTYSELKNLCVWAKDNAGMGTFYRSQHELIFVFKAGKDPHRNNFQLGQYGRYRTNLWRYGGGNSFSRNTEEGNLLELHPTVKPVTLIADAVMDVSVRGDIVLDSFLGSGSTLVACERTDRICCGIELDPVYVDTIVRRWQRFTGLSATHAVSGRSFDELEKEAGQ